MGIFSMFSIQMLANVAMCLFLAPVIGITLPFFSYGGTSILTSLMGVGLVQSVYMRRDKPMFAGQQEE
jgi:rod shape determining protein RodA